MRDQDGEKYIQIILNDVLKYGGAWGILEPATRDYYENQLRTRITNYTNHCIRTYQEGLTTLSRNQDARSWLNFNEFRIDMTLMVLDFVAVFPTYDPVNYPLPTNVELSRIIYTNPVGTSGNEFNTWYLTNRYLANFRDLEREARRTPSLTTWLNRIQIFSGTILHLNETPIEVWYGNNNDYTYTHGGFMSRSDGRTQGEGNPMIINTSNNDIFRLNLRAAFASGLLGNNQSTFGISQSQFINVNGENLKYISS